MPLVFAVLIMLVIVLNAKDDNKRRNTQSAIYAKDGRKTNAAFEQKTMDSYMKQGLSADDAFRRSYEDMVKTGYEPCIPRDAYDEDSSRCVLKSSFNPQDFDSFLVKRRREDYTEDWKIANPGKNPWEYREEIEERVYHNFPKNEAEYIRDVKTRANRKQAEPVGAYIIYPGLGTCEILAHNWIGDGYFGGTYTLKVLKTGQIVSFVKIGDKKISRQ